MKHIFYAIACILALASCGQSPTKPTAPTQPDYFPLQVGNWWEYKANSFDSTYFHRWKIIGDTTINGKQYFKLNMQDLQLPTDTTITSFLIIKDASGNMRWYSNSIFGEKVDMDSKSQWIFNFNKPIGEDWISNPPGKQDYYNHLQHSGIYSKSDTTTVPAGTFSPNCVIKTESIGNTDYLVFATNVGLVKVSPNVGYTTLTNGSYLTRAYVNGKSYP